ncbi:SMI1/KNR4 family protein [Pyxidicoccus fallax]|uniref:SMI1/KNR4 family protein n=2 Tax=Pyxidicoccus fallax TaxID=394095 RepID=A0A848LLR5_9BACT|nr:SMI1/KNR4 family protein [Pyxidicoccus fallax]
MLQDFFTLVERYDPGYSRKVRGASPEEIADLEELAGQPLSECHREFLARMGRNMGGLEVEGVDFHIERITEFYRSGEWTPPPGYILLAIQEDDPQMDYYLECPRPGARDCPVVRFPSMGEFSKETYFYPLDPSLSDFLLALAFSEKRMEALEHQRLLTPSTGHRQQEPNILSTPAALLRVLEERALRLGFKRVARSSGAYRFYESPDAALYARLDDEGGLRGVTVGASKVRELERISDILSNGTSLVIS